MDFPVIKSAVINFVIYLVLQLVIFRFIEKKQVFKWLVAVFFLSVFYSSLLWLIFSPFNFFYFISQILSSLMIMIYVLAVFGVSTTSLRIALLSLIFQNQDGLNLNGILKKYNRETIIDKRVERFVASGQLFLKDGCFQKSGKFSFFLLPASIFKLMWIIYGKSGL